MFVIDDVTASFATSLALAGGDVVDLSHMAGANVRRGSQAYLLARPLTAKPFGGADLQRHLRRIWVLEQGFKVQAQSQNRFVLAFDLRKDKNRVLKGGPWYFNRAPIILQDYDGLSSLHSITLNTLYFWVKITNIPPACEVKETIINVAAIAGKFPEFDRKLFDATGTIRVHVAHDITKPLFLKKTIKLAPGVIEEITFFYENLIGRCRKCNLIFHEAGTCLVTTPPKTKPIAASPTPLNLVSSFPSFKEPLFTDGLFKFHGTQVQVLPVARNLFGNPESSKGRKPIVIKPSHLRPSMQSEDEHEDQALALVPIETGKHNEKRGRPSSPFTSPKKLKFFLENMQGKHVSDNDAKKIKMPEFPSKFTAKSLGLIETPGGMLVPQKVLRPITAMPNDDAKKEQSSKKKRGRPLGAKNKNPSKASTAKKFTAEEVLSVLYSKKPPSPNTKGKGKI